MHLRVAGFLSFFVVLWHWCDGQRIPEDLQKYNISPPNMFGRESPTNKTMDQLMLEALGDLEGANNLKSKNGAILMELDMLLTKQQYSNLYEQTNSNILIRSKRKAIRNPVLRWTNGEIPYRFSPGHFSQNDQKGVRQAMTEWERYTCLRFREATSSDINVIVFSNYIGCYSQLGMVGGHQVVSLSSPWCRNTETYLHEIGHVIGLVHEHNRPDRDDYVEILTQNVLSEMLGQFTKYSLQDVDQMNVPYDYSSIMHYSAKAFSKNGLKTIRVKHPEKGDNIGNVYILSFADVEIVNKMYRCHAKCDPSIQCSYGYVDENCRCVCRNGSQDCQIGGGVKPPGNTCGVNTNGDSWICFVKAQQGECEANSTFRDKECARACGPCGLKRKPETCAKMYPSDKCLKWSRNGDCLTNTEWMNNYCCGTCVNSNNRTGCQNKHNNSLECDLWASEGLCEANPLWMIPNCQKSCRACDTPISTQRPATTHAPDIASCTNKYQDNKLCDTWAKAGQCNMNTWMIQNCARSCDRCSGAATTTTPRPTTKLTTQKSIGDCNNLHSDNRTCDAWAKAGYCKTNQYVTINCARSCGNCSDQSPSTSSNVRFVKTTVKTTTKKSLRNKVNEQAPADDPNDGCRDEKDSCVTWAIYGFCKNNRDQAVRFCPKTCNLCDQRQGLLLR